MHKSKNRKSYMVDYLIRISGFLMGVQGILMLLGPLVVSSDNWRTKMIGVLFVILCVCAVRLNKLALVGMFLVGSYYSWFLIRGPLTTNDILYYWWGKLIIGAIVIFVLSTTILGFFSWKRYKWI